MVSWTRRQARRSVYFFGLNLRNAHCLMDAHSCIPDSQLPERRCFQALRDSLVRRQCLVTIFSSTSVIFISVCV